MRGIMENEKIIRNIPENIKREVRQRCGFGCVICGSPIYEYEHMTEWSIVKVHIADDITLLCPDHHAEKTKGLLPIEFVRKHNLNPYNIKEGKSKSKQLYYYGESCSFIIAGNKFNMKTHRDFPSVLVPIVIDGVPLIGFNMYKGQLFLNANIYDENNKMILKIVNNHLEYSIGVWDITFISNRLTIRQAQRNISLKIKFKVPNIVIIDQAILYYNGSKVIAKKDKIIVGEEGGNKFIGNIFNNIPIGFSIGEESFKNVLVGVRLPIL